MRKILALAIAFLAIGLAAAALTFGAAPFGFTFSSSAPGAKWTCSVDGAAYTACSSPFQASLAPGKHNVRLKATLTIASSTTSSTTSSSSSSSSTSSTSSSSSTSTSTSTTTPTTTTTTTPTSTTTSTTETTSSQQNGCTATVSSTGAVNAALTGGSTVCLAAGSYGSFNVTAKPSSQATLTAAPGAHVVVAGVDVESSNITISQIHITGGGLNFWQKGTEGALLNDVAEYDDVGPTNGYGIGVFCKTSTPCEHFRIAHNRVHNTSTTGEGDALRFDGWAHGEVVGNDIYEIAECASETCHTDTLQSYNAQVATEGLLVERNYVHDCTAAQGFPFLKDGNISNVVIRDNLSLRMASKNQVTGVWIDEVAPGLTVEDNTYQGTSGSQIQTEGGTGSAVVEHNVFDSLNEKNYSLTEDYNDYTGSNEWSFTLGAHDQYKVTPDFNDPLVDDYRIVGGPGVDWAPNEQQYGPSF